MSRVYWDSMLFIYLLEEHPHHARRVTAVHARMKERSDRLLTGAFTFGEVLTGFYVRKNPSLAHEVRKMMEEDVVDEIVPFTTDTADHYARILASLRVSAADAIHLALAAQAGTDLFLTNDKRLIGKFVPGIQFIASIEEDIL